MTIGRSFTTDPLKVLALFDDNERAAYRSEFDLDDGQLAEGHDASDLLHWIVQRRSPFIQMASGIGDLLVTLEASIKGNIEFLVATSDGEEFELAFGPQIRRVVQAAMRWAEQTTPQIRSVLEAAERAVLSLCSACKPRNITRDTPEGDQMRRMAEIQQDPHQRALYEMRANLLRRSNLEYNPIDARMMRDLVQNIEVLRTRLRRSFEDSQATADVFSSIDKMLATARTTAGRASALQSRQYPSAAPRLNDGLLMTADRQLKTFKSAMHAAKELDQVGDSVMEAMALALWKERWRIYELWLFCAVSGLLLRSSSRSRR